MTSMKQQQEMMALYKKEKHQSACGLSADPAADANFLRALQNAVCDD